MANERLISDMTPDEIRKAFAEKAERLIKENAVRAAFLAKIERPEVRAAAKAAAQAQADLMKMGLRVTDWSATGGRITEVELEADCGPYDKRWVKVGDFHNVEA